LRCATPLIVKDSMPKFKIKCGYDYPFPTCEGDEIVEVLEFASQEEAQTYADEQLSDMLGDALDSWAVVEEETD